MKYLWTEIYRPKNVSEYVFKDAKQKVQINNWIKQGALPHILLTGTPGVGKSTLIEVLLNEIKVDPYDVLRVNASKDNGVDFIRDSVTRFSETMGVGSMRYIYLDEADGLSPAAQGVLRGVIERYADSVRFLLTANNQHKILPAIKSRCETGRMHIEKLDNTEFYTRLINVLDNENIEINADALEAIVDKTYPDLRRGISLIQANSINGVLHSPESDNNNDAPDYKIEMIALFRAKEYTKARKLICTQIQQDDYEDIYRYMYTNVEIWTDGDMSKENKAIIVIRDGLVKDTQCADREINLSATLCELEEIANS